ncbi:hypothetical protein V8E51_015858 [Hyaloscypha variabilis]
MDKAFFGGRSQGDSPQGSPSNTANSAGKVYEALMKRIHEHQALTSLQANADDDKTNVESHDDLTPVTFDGETNQVEVPKNTIQGEAFTVFPELALELRRRAWYYALPESRVIEIEWSDGNGGLPGWFYTKESIQRTPNIYRVNKEARKEFLRFYKPVTLNTANIPNIRFPEERITRPKQYEIPFTPVHYFDARVDILYLSMGDYETLVAARMVNYLNTELLKEVRSMAISFEQSLRSAFDLGPPYDLSPNTWDIVSAGQNRYQHLFQRLPALTKLVAVVGDIDPPILYAGQPYYKQKGHVELTELTRNSRGLDITNSTKLKLQAWMEAVVKVNLGAEKLMPVVHVKQVLRGGNLIAVDSFL